MDARLEQGRAFVASAGWANADIAPVSGDASFRRYFRVTADGRTAILMDAPPDREDVQPFLKIDAALRGFGYSAPEIQAHDVAAGFLLLEDLGDDLFARVLERDDAREPELYAAAIDLLRDLVGQPLPPDIPVFDAARALREVELLLEWTLPALSGSSVSNDVAADFSDAWRRALAPLFDAPPVLTLFDYHAENLIWLPQRDGKARVGLLDFQDAVAGPAALDVVSLLEDARRDVAAVTVEAMRARFTQGMDAVARERFDAAYALAGAQRNTRIIGVFGRLWLRDRKPGYLALMPRVWRHLENDLAHPALEGVRRWFDTQVPSDWRRAAPTPDEFVLPEAGR